MVRLFLLSREGPAEMTGIECGELIEEEVEEIWANKSDLERRC